MEQQDVRPSYKPGLLDRLTVSLFHLINKFIPWHKLPAIIGALNLEALRVELRQYNLHDTYPDGAAQGTEKTCPMKEDRFKTTRNSDGLFNSTEMPKMGCAGMRLGRNFPRAYCPKPNDDDLFNPNPRMVSLGPQFSSQEPTLVGRAALSKIKLTSVHDPSLVNGL